MTEITVTSVEALKNAISTMKYSKIVVEGSAAQEAATLMRRSQKREVASGIAIIGGIFFWPAFVVGVGSMIFGSNITNYDLTVFEEDRIVLEMNTKWLKKMEKSERKAAKKKR